jgi:hypothetical protein
MHPDNKQLLIITAIENANVTSIGKTFHATPQVIVIEIFGRGRFERIHLASLRIYA